MNAYDTFLLRFAGAAAAGTYLGYRYGDQNLPSTERSMGGLALGAMVLGPAAATYPLWKSAVMPTARSVGTQIKNVGASWSKSLPQMWKTGLERTPVLPFAAAGAAAGLAFSRPEHRQHDTAVGAAAGTALGVGLKAAGIYKNQWMKAKLPFYAALYTGAALLGSHLAHEGSEQAGVVGADGETQYVSPDQAQSYDSGVRRRMNNMRASGDLVFGLR